MAKSVEPQFVILAPYRTDLYWRPERCGYTTRLGEAGVYTKQEAEGIVRLGRGDRSIPLLSLRREMQIDLEQAEKEVAGLKEKLQSLGQETFHPNYQSQQCNDNAHPDCRDEKCSCICHG